MSTRDDISQLFQDYYPLVYGYILRRVSDAEVAADLSGEVFYKAWRGRDKLAGHSNPRAWLLRITRNTVIDYWRKVKEVPMSEAELADPSTVPMIDEVSREETHWELMRALDQLNGNYKSVLVLRFIEGLPVRRVATLLDISEGNVRTLQFRALAKLRKLVEKSHE